MTEEQCGKWVSKLIDEDRLHEFYVSRYWRRLRKELLEEYKHECQDCKAKGNQRTVDGGEVVVNYEQDIMYARHS